MEGSRPREAHELIRAHLPGVPAGDVRLLGEGDFCRAYLLAGGQVLRVPRHAEAARALRREACLLGRIGGALPVPVPAPTSVETGEEGVPVLSVHRRIEGRELTRALWLGLRSEPRERVARSVGALLGELHRLGVDAGRDCGLETIDHRERAGDLIRRLDGPGAGALGRLRSALRRCLEQYLEGPGPWEYEAALLHGDLSPGHVLVDPEAGEITGVIDWGDAAIGDPARDFIFAYEDWGRDFLDRALGGYGREPPARMRPRVLLHYLVDQLEWTLRAEDEGREADRSRGVAALEEGVREFEGSGP